MLKSFFKFVWLFQVYIGLRSCFKISFFQVWRYCWFACWVPSVRAVCAIMDYSPFAIHSQHCLDPAKVGQADKKDNSPIIICPIYISTNHMQFHSQLNSSCQKIYIKKVSNLCSDIAPMHCSLQCTVGHQINLRLPTTEMIS